MVLLDIGRMNGRILPNGHLLLMIGVPIDNITNVFLGMGHDLKSVFEYKIKHRAGIINTPVNKKYSGQSITEAR